MASLDAIEFVGRLGGAFCVHGRVGDAEFLASGDDFQGHPYVGKASECYRG